MIQAAQARGETAIGYRTAGEAADSARSYGVYTNPKKSSLITFSPGDKIIVLAEQ